MCVLSRTSGENNFYVTSGVKNALLLNHFVAHPPANISMNDQLLTEIKQRSEIFDYIQYVAIPILFTSKTTSGDEITDTSKLNIVVGQNKLLGALFRQLRVKESTCIVTNPKWKCFPQWNAEYESKITKSGVEWQSAADLNDIYPWIGLTNSYEGSGFAVIMPMNGTEAFQTIENLKKHDFLDRQTRLVVLDFNLYNPSLNLHSLGRLAFETPASGGVLPHIEIKTWRLNRYEGTRGRAALTFEILFVLFVFYFTFDEIRDAKLQGWTIYKQDRWNLIDFFNIIFFYFSLTFTVLNANIAFRQSSDLQQISDGSTYFSFRDIQRFAELESYFQMVNGFLLFIKMFKYMTFSNRVRFLFRMLQRSSQDLLVFCLLLIVIVLCFGLAGFLAFSSDVDDFRSFPHSVMNLIRFTVTEPNYASLRASNRALGSVFFVAWGVLMLLILANVFIAILSDAYTNVALELSKEDEKVLENLKARISSFADRLVNITNVWNRADANHDGKIDAQELATAMNIPLQEAEQLINDHDVDHDHKLSVYEFAALIKKRQSDNQLAQSETSAWGTDDKITEPKDRDPEIVRQETLGRISHIEDMIQSLASTNTTS